MNTIGLKCSRIQDQKSLEEARTGRHLLIYNQSRQRRNSSSLSRDGPTGRPAGATWVMKVPQLLVAMQGNTVGSGMYSLAV